MIVVDASAMFEVLCDSEKGKRHGPALTSKELHAPQLLDVELFNAFRRVTLLGQFDAHRAQTLLGALQTLDIARHGHTAFLDRMWAFRNAISSFDSAYVALAESLNAPLWTCDGRLARSRGHQAEIVLLA